MPVNEQIEKLAAFIMAEVDGEPSQSEGAGDTAIRVIKSLEAENEELKDRLACCRKQYDDSIAEIHKIRNQWHIDLSDKAAAERKLGIAEIALSYAKDNSYPGLAVKESELLNRIYRTTDIALSALKKETE